MFFRMFFGVPGAAFVTALLFLAMAWMVKQDDSTLVDPVPSPELNIIMKRIMGEPPVNPNVRPKPIPAPEPIKTQNTTTQKNPGGVIGKYEPPIGAKESRIIDIDFGGTTPAVTFPPMYPENCRARGAEGVVLVEFDVTPDGSVTNARVVASENSCLDRAALQTISKWKYTPKKDSSGRAVAQRGLRKSFNFQLTDS